MLPRSQLSLLAGTARICNLKPRPASLSGCINYVICLYFAQELLDSGYLTEVHKFSKFIHGTATLFPDMVRSPISLCCTSA